ncbi:MAG: hypothetical protein OES69_15935 [Myxococcales bacterium]|jgi:hypothetical protein|nr:hypothetical protein [Myxococcales bacterium]MDH3845433.1 hypothetical protein [Myxococcales bacterium]
MAKKKNERREARKERAKAAKEAKREAEAEALRTRRRWRLASIAVAVLSIALAALSYWVLEDRRLVGVSLLVGGVLFLLLALGSLGAGVKPRDRRTAGSIDFGKRD